MQYQQIANDLDEVQRSHSWSYLDDAFGTKNPKDVNYWLAVYSPNKWSDLMYKGCFGLGDRYLDLWLDVRPRDVVFFYATEPVEGFFGMSVVQQTCFRDEWECEETFEADAEDDSDGEFAHDLDMLIEFDFFSGWEDPEWFEKSLPLNDLNIRVNRQFRRLSLVEAYPLIQEAFL